MVLKRPHIHGLVQTLIQHNAALPSKEAARRENGGINPNKCGRRERNEMKRGWRKKKKSQSKQAWFPCWDLARSGNILCFTLIPALAVTFVGRAYLLESPKTALALLTAIPSKVLIERHKRNSQKKQWDRRKNRTRKRDSKAQRKERKTLRCKITLKTSTSRGLAITAGLFAGITDNRSPPPI